MGGHRTDAIFGAGRDAVGASSRLMKTPTGQAAPRLDSGLRTEHPSCGNPSCIEHGVDRHLAPERRHQATERLWAWLENGPGLLRKEEDRALIRAKAEDLDRELHRLDVEHHRDR